MSTRVEWKAPHHIHIKDAHRISRRLHLPYLVAQIMADRGIYHVAQAKRYLHPELSQLGNPFMMHDMKRGIDRIRKAIRDHERITIYGDYDVDGITSVSIMYMTLKYFGADVHYYIPNRFRDGYGPNEKVYKKIFDKGTTLLITTDNGIAGMKPMKYAKKRGVDVILTDHHNFPKHLPPAYAIIMTLFPGHHYPNETDFCGAGVAFKIAQAMFGKVPTQFLDLAAISAVADSMKITKENRVFVAYGLKRIRRGSRLGIRALAKVSGTNLPHMTATGLSFSFNPMLNSLGRISDATCGVELMTTHDPHRAMEIAEHAQRLNIKRKAMMARATKDAIAQAEQPKNMRACTLVIANHNYHPGIVGIVAQRLKEKFHKPTLVIGHTDIDNDRGIDRGSGRSIDGFDMFKAMTPLLHKGYMTQFGGHSMACGFSIKPSTINDLRKGLEIAGEKQHLEKLHPIVQPDCILPRTALTRSVLDEMNVMEPFGIGNEQPLIEVRLPYIYNVHQMGKTSAHLCFTLGEAKSSTRVVAWHKGTLYSKLNACSSNVELIGNLQNNYFNKHNYLQFKANHIRYYNPDIPTGYECNQAYKCLLNAGTVKYKSFLTDIIMPFSEHFGISEAKASNILQIFKELKLVTTTHNRLTAKMPKGHYHLADSSYYNKLVKADKRK